MFGALLLFIHMLFLFCCSSDETSKESGPQSNILRIGTPNKVKSANIFLDSYLSIFAHLSNPPLMKPDEEGNPVGQLVSDLKISTDKKTWTFVLKDDLYWSDGKKVTPEDVKFSIEYTGDKNPVAGWIKETIEEISTSENNSITLTLKRPYNRLNIEFMTYKILPQHIWKNIADPMKYTNAGPEVGCGPFYLKETDLYRGVIVFEKNPFWKGIDPKINGVEIHLFQNMDILSLALEKGTIDTYYKYSSSYPYPNLRKLKSQGRFGFIEK
jgi:peptide/nickel transport system substrate-binding protein